MATQQAAPPAPWRQAVAQYLHQSRRPLAALAFVFPLMALYEGGVVLLGGQAVRNGADVWLRQILDRIGFGHYFLLPALTVGLLLAWHYTSRERWQLSAAVLYVMFAECAVLGLALVGIARLQAVLVEATIVGWHDTSAVSASLPELLAGRGALVGRMLGFIGAGVYEEALFRLLLLPPVIVCAAQLGARPGVRIACAVLLTSLVFSAAHYVGARGEAFEAFSFSFRATAGVFFALLFVYRGFGIAAGTHALYDIFVSFG